MTSLRDGRALRQQNIYDLNRERLINTAVQVINEVGDIREVTLTQIAKEAGVSPQLHITIFLKGWRMCIQL